MPITVDGSAGIVGAPGGLTSAGTTGVGYTTGAGGTVTQATSKSTTVTLNTATGQITMNNAALAANTVVSMQVNNTTVSATDTVLISFVSGTLTAGAYSYTIRLGSGAFILDLKNISAGSLSEAIAFNFAIIKGATA